MAKRVKLTELDKAIAEAVREYRADVTAAVNTQSAKSMKKLVRATKATAPVGRRGTYKRRITSKLLRKSEAAGDAHVWYVKAPDYRLTHLLVHGHATRDGGRTEADPFLHNAVAAVIGDYEKKVEAILKNGK